MDFQDFQEASTRVMDNGTQNEQVLILHPLPIVTIAALPEAESQEQEVVGSGRRNYNF